MPMEAEDVRSSFLATTVHLLEMNGESYRLKRSRENTAAQAPDELDNPQVAPQAGLTHCTRPACCHPASVTLFPNNWRGHLRWPITSLVVHFCSAPLACFVDDLDTLQHCRAFMCYQPENLSLVYPDHPKLAMAPTVRHALT